MCSNLQTIYFEEEEKIRDENSVRDDQKLQVSV